jgi:hypothetical protein
MPGYLLHEGATVMCMHGSSAEPMLPDSRVTVSGQPIVTQTCVYTVAGCPLPAPIISNGPCATCTWITAATRVTASGIPVVLQDSQAVCVLPATGLNIVETQVRVKGT